MENFKVELKSALVTIVFFTLLYVTIGFLCAGPFASFGYKIGISSFYDLVTNRFSTFILVLGGIYIVGNLAVAFIGDLLDGADSLADIVKEKVKAKKEKVKA